MELLTPVQDDHSEGHGPSSLRTSSHFKGESAIPCSPDHPCVQTANSTCGPDETGRCSCNSVRLTRHRMTITLVLCWMRNNKDTWPSRKLAKIKLSLRYYLNKSKPDRNPWTGFVLCTTWPHFWASSRHWELDLLETGSTGSGTHITMVTGAARESGAPRDTTKHKCVLWQHCFPLLTKLRTPARISCPAHCWTF